MGTVLLIPSTLSIIIGFGLASLGIVTLIPAATQSVDELPGQRRLTAIPYCPVAQGFLQNC